MGELCWINKSVDGDSTTQMAGPQESAADVLVADITGHIIHRGLAESMLFRQVVLMLWLISVFSVYVGREVVHFQFKVHNYKLFEQQFQ